MCLTIQVLIISLLTGFGWAQIIYLTSHNLTHSTNGNQTNSLTFDNLVKSEQFANGRENLTLKLSPGIHILTQLLTVDDFSFVQLIGNNSVLHFIENGTIFFSNIDQLLMQNIKFTYGSGNASISIDNIINLSVSNCSFFGFSQGVSDSFVIQIKGSSNITFDHVIFKDNLATALSIINGKEVRISDSVFENNQNGAAKFTPSNDTNIRISSCNFTQNRAIYGGAIEFFGDTKAHLTISDSMIHGNRGTNGGGIFASSNYVLVSNSKLTCNTAEFGGATYIIGSNLEISQSVIHSNNATQSGGGIYILSSDTSLTDRKVFKNHDVLGVSLEKGGAIYAQSSNVHLIDINLINNNAINGGAVYAGRSSNVSFSTSFINGNSATKSGGGIHSFSSNISISYCQFTNNHATTTLGGAIYAHKSGIYISNSSHFIQNSAIWGGAIFSHPESDILISDSVVANNSANKTGGGIYVSESEISIINSRLTRNNATDGGAVYTTRLLNITLKNCIVNNNFAINQGGGFYAYLSMIYINTTKLGSNVAFQGGAIYHRTDSYLLVTNSTLEKNVANGSGGSIFGVVRSVTNITASVLTENSAKRSGGAVFAHGPSTIVVLDSIFDSNRVNNYGGSIYARESTVFITNSQLIRSSSSKKRGGAIYAEDGDMNITNSTITHNTATYGGAICIKKVVLSLSGCQLKNNTVSDWGGGIFADQSSLYIIRTEVIANKGGIWGGGIYVEQSVTNIFESQLTHNVANYGAAMYSYSSVSIRNSQMLNNIATIAGALHIQFSTLVFRGSNTLSYNRGSSLYALDCEVRFEGPTTLSNNDGLFGGAIYSVQSIIHFNTEEAVIIVNNTAESGGGIFLRESTLKVNQPFQCISNTAQIGGGIFAYLSVLNFESQYWSKRSFLSISGNTAHQNGGGIAAISSTITLLRFYVYINENTASSNGGGVYLQQNSKVHVLKVRHETTSAKRLVMLQIKNNRVHFGSGGGVYVDDSTETGSTCRGGSMNQETQNVISECFIQTINLYDVRPQNDTSYVNTFITNNTALNSRSDVYGGLLDRCTLNPFAEFYSSSNGVECFRNTVETSSGLTIASDPVKVILCNGSDNNNIIESGGLLKVNVMAIDQIGNPLNTTINGLVVTESGVGRLKEGQTRQYIDSQCTELVYNVFSQDSHALIELFADGPCADIGASKQTLSVTFIPCGCAVGFQQVNNSIECSCDCDIALEQYGITECSHDQGTLRIESNIWIGIEERNNFLHDTVHYNVFECPFDYCAKRPIAVSLSNRSSINQQCASNRSGIMCGKCKPGLSLVLGSSKCQHCSNVYLLLLVPFALGGIVLVAFILFLNITVATGSILGLIFYANVLASNTSSFLPSNSLKFFTVFIHWINLDLGIETCFYDGMSSQAKVLLQLVFPTYLFLLMFFIVILSKYSNSFAKILSNRNPVAALGTLLLLSYSKFQRFIIVALKFETLHYPNRIIRFYDGNIQFFTANHYPQFLAAFLITILGVLFIILLLFGQYFLRCSEWKLMKWTKNTIFNGFMDVYHAPFTPKHRYWVGLLLLTLIIQNLVAAFSPNQFLPVFSAGCLPVGILMLKAAFMNKVYKMWLNDYLETLFLLNLTFLALGTMYMNNTDGNTFILTSTSASIAFLTFVFGIIGFHFYEFVLKKSDWFRQMCQVLKNIRAQQKRIPIRRPDHVPPKEENEPENLNIVYRSRADGATRPDKLRLSYLDELAPVGDSDYSPAASFASSSNEHSVIVVTHTVA